MFRYVSPRDKSCSDCHIATRLPSRMNVTDTVERTIVPFLSFHSQYSEHVAPNDKKQQTKEQTRDKKKKKRKEKRTRRVWTLLMDDVEFQPNQNYI